MYDKDQVRKLLRCPVRWLGLSGFSDPGRNITYLKQCPCYVMVLQHLAWEGLRRALSHLLLLKRGTEGQRIYTSSLMYAKTGRA